MMIRLASFFLLFPSLVLAARPTTVPADSVLITGLSPTSFDLSLWQAGGLHFLPDARSPLLDPLPGKFRNIYAPSAIELPDHTYRLFYGGWDGVTTGNDRIYSLTTPDFLTFSDRRLVVDHGPFEHVNNVSAVLNDDHSFTLMCTAYPVGPQKLNRPALFRVATTRPLTASQADLIDLDCPADADINGLNPILRDPADHTLRLYYADFHHFGDVFLAKASHEHPATFVTASSVLHFAAAPNDVKRVGDVYLLALHMNGPHLWYAVSADGTRFGAPSRLIDSHSPADRYITSVCFVARDGNPVGVLYGAGSVPSLDRNRIFAAWLQRKVVFTPDGGAPVTATHSFGPDAAVLPLSKPTAGTLQLISEAGVTPVGPPRHVTLAPATAYSAAENSALQPRTK